MFADRQQTPKEVEAIKEKREEFASQIRRATRDEIISKKRYGGNAATKPVQNQNTNATTNTTTASQEESRFLELKNIQFFAEHEQFIAREYDLSEFTHLITCVRDKDPVRMLYGVVGFRKLLSKDAAVPVVQMVVDANLVPKFLEFIRQTQYPFLQLEACWCLTNIASGTTHQCQSIIDKGGIPLIVDLLASPHHVIKQQAVWAVGNIGGDNASNRDLVIKCGGIGKVCKVINQTSNSMELVKTAVWALSNLCRSDPTPKYEQIKEALPILAKAINSPELNDESVMADCCWALSYFLIKRTRVHILLEYGILDTLIRNLGSSTYQLIMPCLRLVGVVTTGTEDQTQQVIDKGFMPYAEMLLNHQKKIVRKEVCWALSNIAAGSKRQVNQILSNSRLLCALKNKFETDNNEIKKEIAWIFSNVAQNGNPAQVLSVIQNLQIMKGYVIMLQAEDAKTVEYALETLNNLMSFGNIVKGENNVNPVIQQLSTYRGVEILEGLQYHKVTKIYDAVYKILETFFTIQDPLA